MTRTSVFAFFAALVVSFVAYADDSKSPAPLTLDKNGHAAPLVISVVGTNDVHGHVESLPVLGGYLNNLRRVRKNTGGVLLVDAGDMFQGTLESNLFEGEPMVKAYQALGYDAVTLGNHEFDYGPVGPKRSAQTPKDDPQGAVKARVAQARFPVLATNLVTNDGKRPAWKNLKPSIMRTIAGVKVGVIGLLTTDTPFTTFPANFNGLKIAPLVDAVKEEAARLQKLGAQLIVVTAHAGSKCSAFDDPKDVSSCDTNDEIFRLAKGLPEGLVQVIVAGHTHQRIAHQINGIAIIESGNYGKAFGRVDVMIDRAKHTVVETRIFKPQYLCKSEQTVDDKCETFGYEANPVSADKNVEKVLASYLKKAKVETEKPLHVTLPEALPYVRDRESVLGNVVASAILASEASDKGAQAALMNGGGIRSGLPKGELRYKDVYAVMPFDDTPTVAPIKVSELKSVFTRLAAADGSFLYVAGLKITGWCGPKGLVIDIADAQGKALKDDDTVKLAMPEFIAVGGNGIFTNLALTPDMKSAVLIRDAIQNYLIAKKEAVLTETDSRISYPSKRPVNCPVRSKK